MFGGIQVRSDSEGESKLTSGAASDESPALGARVGKTSEPMNGRLGSLNQYGDTTLVRIRWRVAQLHERWPNVW
jgi:hypothetical protein